MDSAKSPRSKGEKVIGYWTASGRDDRSVQINGRPGIDISSRRSWGLGWRWCVAKFCFIYWPGKWNWKRTSAEASLFFVFLVSHLNQKRSPVLDPPRDYTKTWCYRSINPSSPQTVQRLFFALTFLPAPTLIRPCPPVLSPVTRFGR